MAVRYLEYIESTGTQCINTKFKPNQNTDIEIKVKTEQTGSFVFAGCDTGWQDHSYTIQAGFISYEHQSTEFTMGSKITTFSCFDGVWKKDGITVWRPTISAFQTEYDFYLFALNRSNDIREHASARLYLCKIYDNGSLAFDYRPAIDPDGIVCVYDEIAKKYEYNVGTGTFIAGPELNTTRCRLPKKIMIASGGTQEPSTPTEYVITVTGTGNSNRCYATINGTKVTAAGQYTVAAGTAITLGIGASTSQTFGATITVNGTQVKKVSKGETGTYDYTPTSNITIALKYSSTSSSATTITVTST